MLTLPLGRLEPGTGPPTAVNSRSAAVQVRRVQRRTPPRKEIPSEIRPARHLVHTSALGLVCAWSPSRAPRAAASHHAPRPSVFEGALRDKDPIPGGEHRGAPGGARRTTATVVLDARPFAEYAVSHIPGARSVPGKPGLAAQPSTRPTRVKSFVPFPTGHGCWSSTATARTAGGASVSAPSCEVGLQERAPLPARDPDLAGARRGDPGREGRLLSFSRPTGRPSWSTPARAIQPHDRCRTPAPSRSVMPPGRRTTAACR